MSQVKQSLARGAVMGLVIASIVIGSQFVLSSRRLPQKELPVYGQIPAVELTEKSGKVMNLSELEGKVWVADFIFTRCAGPCPLMSAKMKQLQKSFAGNPGIKSVSFSVDPKFDTPEVLASYAGRFSADPDRWYFFTGDEEKIFELSKQHFFLSAGKVPDDQVEEFGQSIHHSSKFILVDSFRQIRGYYDSAEAEDMDRLIRDALSLRGGRRTL